MKTVIVAAISAILTMTSMVALTTSGCSSQGQIGDTSGTGGTAGAVIKLDASSAGGGGAGGGWPGGLGGASPGGPCENLQCRQSTCKNGNCTVSACSGGARTTLRGRIFDPAGKVPLYNISVYVPNKPLDPIADGPSCDPCDPKTGTSLLSGQPIALAKTDVNGNFTLGLAGTGNFGDVPAGDNVPLVIQVGKWRREVTIAKVPACTETEITDADLMRLPRNQSEGHIPKIALTTGELDALECLLRKVGISDSEFTPESGSGRVNLYAGGGGATAYDSSLNGGAAYTSVRPWWDSLDNLKKYDIVLHACEGSQGSFSATSEPASVKSTEARKALQDFADLGGRVFASHWHVYWFEKGPAAFQSIATFRHRSPGLANPYNATVDRTHAKGQALAEWLVNVGGSTTLGTLPLAQEASQTTVDAVAGDIISQRWIYAADRNPQAVQYLTATTPIPNGTCGRVVLSDIHVSSGTSNGDTPKKPFPTGCTADLSPQQKALEFMLFDIASCVDTIIPIL